MTSIQLKTEIHKVIDEIPENVLPYVFDYLKAVQHQSPDQIKLNKFIEKVFIEDDELLRRLAQ
ncbi:MAG: hypothetical protein ABI203_01015 [Mucilaginibacter sp.]